MAVPTIPSSSLGTAHVSSAALQDLGARPRRTQRRPIKQATYELTNHAKAYLEGGQLSSGFDFLSNLLSAGTSISTPAKPYLGFLAPPAYLAFAASAVVDPTFTTQARSSYTREGADAALRYLQCVQVTVDRPAYPTIKSAFSFPAERTRRRFTGHRSAAVSPSPDLGGDIERISGVDANESSLWYRAEDFWHIVGWAFNCSVVHEKRWERWRLWLRVLLDFLETDWDFCVKLGTADEANTVSILKESLIWYYIAGDAANINRSARRRIVKAVLAAASADSCKEYPEIWGRETAELRRKRESDQPLTEVDFENGDMGDYDSDEPLLDSSVGEQVLHDHQPVARNIEEASKGLGGTDAIALRQRLISLLARVAIALPAHFTTLSDFFDNVLEDFNSLPITHFQVLLSTLSMSPLVQLAFNANLLLPLVTGKIPDYFRYDPPQEQFESKLLPLRATSQSFVVNARVSLILEQMFLQMMRRDDALVSTITLREAVERGIAARQGVHGTARGKKSNAAEEEHAKEVMAASSERLFGLLEILEIRARHSSPSTPEKMKGDSNSALRSFTSGSSLSPAPDSDTDMEDESMQ
ncbi:hypothetical protein ACN47E_009423 [Coniothyrium glycines]